MTTPVKMAVIGAGSMGANHIRVINNLPGAELIAVIDQDVARARTAVGKGPVEILSSIDDISPEVEAAVVAVPTAGHIAVASALARRGVNLLVEKPLASTVNEAEDLVATAESSGVILAVGHVERFNPAIYELPRLLDQPVHFEASRISPFTPRVGDGVIFDLMIHDIDIVCSLTGPNAIVSDVTGVARIVKGDTEDIASVTMAFTSGHTATFNTSRLGQTKIRTLEITQSESAISVDLLRQDITISRMSQHEYLSDDGATRHRQSNVVEIPFLETRGEPLALELVNFIESVRQGTAPHVDGTAGARAVQIAQRAVDSVRMIR